MLPSHLVYSDHGEVHFKNGAKRSGSQGRSGVGAILAGT
jgi:hypothetical protein